MRWNPGALGEVSRSRAGSGAKGAHMAAAGSMVDSGTIVGAARALILCFKVLLDKNLIAANNCYSGFVIIQFIVLLIG